MQRSNVFYLAGAAVIAAAFTAALTPAVGQAVTLMLALVGGGLFAGGAWYRGKEDQADIEDEFKGKFSPAVRRFLGVLGRVYGRYDHDDVVRGEGEDALMALALEANIPDLEGGPDTDHEPSQNLYEFVVITYERKLFPSRDIEDEFEDSRMTMVCVYQRWVRKLETKRLTNRFEGWLTDTIGDNHATVFKLWLYVEFALGRTQEILSEPKLGQYRPLVEQWY